MLRNSQMKNTLRIVVVALLVCTFLTACATTPPNPSAIVPPKPILGNGGKYMCPYTQDGVVAPWCDKGINVAIGSTIGKTAGTYLGAELCRQIPFVGGFIGNKVGSAVGRKIAIESCGGMKYIKDTSDLSFNNVDDLIVWMYATKSGNEHYKAVLKATSEIYPEVQDDYSSAIRNAPRK